MYKIVVTIVDISSNQSIYTTEMCYNDYNKFIDCFYTVYNELCSYDVDNNMTYTCNSFKEPYIFAEADIDSEQTSMLMYNIAKKLFVFLSIQPSEKECLIEVI